MPLQQLVEYFNDRLELEHNNGFRPFVLDHGVVHGLFGPIRISSTLAPIRETLRSSTVIGHAAQIKVAANPAQLLQSGELENFLHISQAHNCGAESLINFDRLSRTVHMLNYLPLLHEHELLFLDVDPRHILGVKEDHGAYFEEIIRKCGLQTSSVVIGLVINSSYARFFSALLKGLQNYQHRGYRLALKFDVSIIDKSTDELISRVSPDFVGVSAQDFNQIKDNQLLGKIQRLNSLVTSTHGRSMLLNIDDKFSAAMARQTGFDLVQGDYFEQPITTANPAPAYFQHANSLAVAAAV